jgi:hypothetical protein
MTRPMTGAITISKDKAAVGHSGRDTSSDSSRHDPRLAGGTEAHAIQQLATHDTAAPPSRKREAS